MAAKNANYPIAPQQGIDFAVARQVSERTLGTFYTPSARGAQAAVKEMDQHTQQAFENMGFPGRRDEHASAGSGRLFGEMVEANP